MKKRQKNRDPVPLDPVVLGNSFLRGFVATGLLGLMQDRQSPSAPSGGTLLRRAVQGGAALAAGIATADSLRRQDYGAALLALAGGAVAVGAAERLFVPHHHTQGSVMDIQEQEIEGGQVVEG